MPSRPIPQRDAAAIAKRVPRHDGLPCWRRRTRSAPLPPRRALYGPMGPDGAPAAERCSVGKANTWPEVSGGFFRHSPPPLAPARGAHLRVVIFHAVAVARPASGR